MSWCAGFLRHGPPLVELHQAEKLVGSSGINGDAPGTLQTRRHTLIIASREHCASQSAAEYDAPKDTAQNEAFAIPLFEHFLSLLSVIE
jgi:hypothetical protein